MFKIRKKIFPEKGYESCEKEYERFLENNQKLIPKAFFTMFHHDYFHDGIIKIKKIDLNHNELLVDIDCPNFTDKNGTYVDIEFSCRFSHVYSFSLTPELIAKSKSDPVFRRSIFLQCEIGTLVDPRTAQSLIMKCLSSDNRVFYISLIFKNCELYPKDPEQFRRLKSREKIHLE